MHLTFESPKRKRSPIIKIPKKEKEWFLGRERGDFEDKERDENSKGFKCLEGEKRSENGGNK